MSSQPAGIFKIFEKKVKPTFEHEHGFNSSNEVSPSSIMDPHPEPRQHTETGAEQFQGSTANETPQPNAAPKEKRPLFALFQQKKPLGTTSSGTEGTNVSSSVEEPTVNESATPDVDSAGSSAPRYPKRIRTPAVEVPIAASRSRDKKSGKVVSTLSEESSKESFPPHTSRLQIYSGESLKKNLQSKEILDVDAIAPIFVTEALRELKRQREKDAALQIEKQRSRETEMAFFKSETAAGKSLNSILMQNSLQAGRPPQVSSDSTFASGFVQCKKVNFAETVNFPRWQHVGAVSLAAERSSVIQTRPSGPGGEMYPPILIVNRAKVGTSNSDMDGILVSQCDVIDLSSESLSTTDPANCSSPCTSFADANDPFVLDSFSLRGLWLEYMTSKQTFRRSSSRNEDFVCMKNIVDISVDEAVGPEVVDITEELTPHKNSFDANMSNVMDMLTPSSFKDFCGNKKPIRIFKRWLSEWIKVDENRKQKQIARELKRVRGEKSLTKNDNKVFGKSKNAGAKSLNLSMPLSRKVVKNSVDSDGSWDEECDIEACSDFEDEGEEDVHSKVFILQGPTGCGKTSLVYAAAQELGFTVKEENTLNCRTGNQVKRRVFETSLSKGVTSGGSAQMKSSQSNDSLKMEECVSKSGSPILSPTHGMKIILFDEADIVFEDDAGMYRAIAELAKDSKCPIVLTTHRELLGGDSRTALSSIKPAPVVGVFSRPGFNEITGYLVAAARKLGNLGYLPLATVTSSGFESDVYALVVVCRGDVRACLSSLHALLQRKSSDVVSIDIDPFDDADTAQDEIRWRSLRPSGFYQWLISSGREESTLLDPLTAVITGDLGQALNGSEAPSDSLRTSAEHHTYSIDTVYAAPVIATVLPKFVSPYETFVLHVSGRNFLQYKICRPTDRNFKCSSEEIAPVFAWFCGSRYNATIVTDELLLVNIPKLLEECSDSRAHGSALLGSQFVVVQVGGSEQNASGYDKCLPLVRSDITYLSREFYRFSASASPEHVPFVTHMLSDPLASSSLSWITVVDPGSRWSKSSTLKKQKLSLTESSTTLSHISISKSNTGKVSVGKDDVPYLKDVESGANSSPKKLFANSGSQGVKKRGRNNIVNDEDDDDFELAKVEGTPQTACHIEGISEMGFIDQTPEFVAIANGTPKSNIMPGNLEEKRHILCNMIDELLQNPKCHPFAEPVDLECYPSYKEVVSRPLDLGTIRTCLLEGFYDQVESSQDKGCFRKLRKGSSLGGAGKAKYESCGQTATVNVEAFVEDVRLVWNNCFDFNDAQSMISFMAADLSKQFEAILLRDSSILLRDFSWTYTNNGSLNRRACNRKRDVSGHIKDYTSRELTISDCFEKARTDAKDSKLMDDDGGNFDIDLNCALPVINLPSDTDIVELLKNAEQARVDRRRLVMATLNNGSSFDWGRGLSEQPKYLSLDAMKDAADDMDALAALLSTVSASDVLSAPFEFSGSKSNPFCSISESFGFRDGPGMYPSSIQDTVEESIGTCCSDEPVANLKPPAFFSTIKNNNSGIESNSSLASDAMPIEDSTWIEFSRDKRYIKNMPHALNTSCAQYTTATPFSGFSWRQGWAGINVAAADLRHLALKSFTDHMGHFASRKTSVEKLHKDNVPSIFGEANPLDAFFMKDKKVRSLMSILPLSALQVNYSTSCIVTNKSSRWALNRDIVLDGLPLLRAMIQAEGELSEDGKTYCGVSRFTADGVDISSITGSTDNGSRTSTRLSVNKKLLKYNYAQNVTGKSEDTLKELGHSLCFTYTQAA